jgi:hypothetical protein
VLRGILMAAVGAFAAACTHSHSPGPGAAQTMPASAMVAPTPAPAVTPASTPGNVAASAAPAPKALDVSWTGFHENIQPIMELHCYPCHSAERTEKDVRWDLIQDAQSLHDRRDQFSRALGMLYAGKMPPICAYPLSNEETVTLISFMEARMKVDPPAPTPPAAAVSQAGP